MLCMTSPGLIYLITGSLYLLTPFTYSSPHPPTPPPASGNDHRRTLLIRSPYEVGTIIIPSFQIIHGILRHKKG